MHSMLFGMPADKRAFYRSKYIFLNGDIVHCALGNGVDSYVNEGQWLSECRVILAERKKEEKSIFDRVWFSRRMDVLEGAAMYSGIILHVDNDSEA